MPDLAEEERSGEDGSEPMLPQNPPLSAYPTPVEGVRLTVPANEAAKLRAAFKTHSTADAILRMVWLWNVPEEARLRSGIVGRNQDGSEVLDVVIPKRDVQRMKARYSKTDAGEALLGALLFVLGGLALSEAFGGNRKRRRR